MGIFVPNVEKLEANKDINGLKEALNYKDIEIQQAATKSLVNLLIDGDYSVYPSAGEVILEIGEPAIKHLIYALKNDKKYRNYPGFRRD